MRDFSGEIAQRFAAKAAKMAILNFAEITIVGRFGPIKCMPLA